MRSIKNFFLELLLDGDAGFEAYLESLETDPPISCKVLKDGLDVSDRAKSEDFPHLVIDTIPDKIVRSPASSPSRGQLRQGGFDVVIAVYRDKTYKSYFETKEQAEILMEHFAEYLDTKRDTIRAAGYSDLRYRDDDENWGVFLARIGGVDCVAGRMKFGLEYEWSQGVVMKNKPITLRRS